MLSIMDWRLEPLPDASTPILKVLPLTLHPLRQLHHLHAFPARFALGHLADEELVRFLPRDRQHHPDAAVEGPEHFVFLDVAIFLQQGENRGLLPAVPLD